MGFVNAELMDRDGEFLLCVAPAFIRGNNEENSAIDMKTKKLKSNDPAFESRRRSGGKTA